MSVPIAKSGIVRFGTFEADLRSGELRKGGVKVKLEGQPFQVLAALLEQPGELVTREELQKQLWPDETFVDFEQGINAAVKRLRLALQDSADKPRFIETLPRRGYRFIAPVENGAQPPPAAQIARAAAAGLPFPEDTPTAQPTLKRRFPSRRRTMLIALAAAIVVVLLVFRSDLAGWRDRLLGRPMEGEITSIAVLPLENLTGNAEQEYFVDGMTEALITELGKISALRVISRTSAMAFKGSKKPLPEIARQLGVDAVLEGAVARDRDRVRITTRLVHLSQERTLWAQSYERDLRDISALQGEIALVVAGEIRIKVRNQEQARLAQARPVDPRAYESFLKGRYLQARRTPDDMRKALVYFQHALEIDAGYAPAYVGIIDCYSIGGGRQMEVSIREADAKMKEAARKVVQLDDSTAAAHYAIAIVKWHEWDFPGAEKEFQRALQLDPGDVQVRQHYAHYLLSMRRPTDARHEIQQALALDPLSSLLTVDLGFTYYYDHQFPAAIEQGQKALQMEPDFPYARNMLASVYWDQGRFQESLALWPSQYEPERTRRAKEIYQRAGQKAMLRWLVEDAEQHNATGDFYSRSAEVARGYAELNEKERALTWLEKAYQERDPWLPMDLAGPTFDPLRSDPRFQELLRRMSLPV